MEEEAEKVNKEDKEKVKAVEKKILTFMQSQNSYKKVLRSQAENLLSKLEKQIEAEELSKPKEIDYTLWILIGGVVLIVLAVAIWWLVKSKQKKKIKG